jgi:hypothetical protein
MKRALAIVCAGLAAPAVAQSDHEPDWTLGLQLALLLPESVL